MLGYAASDLISLLRCHSTLSLPFLYFFYSSSIHPSIHLTGTDTKYFEGKYDLVQFSDIFRYLILYKYGGTFSDVDSILIQPMITKNNRQNLIGRVLASPCKPAKFEDITTKCLPNWIGFDYDNPSRYDVDYDWYLSNGLFVGMSPKSKFILRLLESMKDSYSANCECCLGRNLLTRAYGDLYFPSTVSSETNTPIFRAPRPFVKTLPVTRMWLWRFQVDPKTRKTIGLIDTPFDESNFEYWIKSQNSYTVHLDTQATCASGSYCDVLLDSVMSIWISVQNTRRASSEGEEREKCVSSSTTWSDSSSSSSSSSRRNEESPDWEKRTTILIAARMPWRIQEPPSSITEIYNSKFLVTKWKHATSSSSLRMLLQEYDTEEKRFVVLRLSWLTLSSKNIPMSMGGWIGTARNSHQREDGILIVEDAMTVNAPAFGNDAKYAMSPKASPFEFHVSDDVSKNGRKTISAYWVGDVS